PTWKAPRMAARGERASRPWSSRKVFRVFQASSKVNSNRWMAESRINSSLGRSKAAFSLSTARAREAICALSFSSLVKEDPFPFHHLLEPRGPGELHQVQGLEDGEAFQGLPKLRQGGE